MSNFRFGGSLLVVVFLMAGCGPRPERAPAIGEAYVGPATLNLRQEISLRSTVVATVKHGERLEILQRRRRFLKVRTPQGREGWTDSRQMLTTEQMAELRAMAERSAKLPSQGKATVFDALNMHTEPSRQSPSFYQLREGEAVEAIGQRLAPRTGLLQTSPPVAERRPAPKPARKPSGKRDMPSSAVPPPPVPPPPPPPSNWLELSRPPSLPAEPSPGPWASVPAGKAATPVPMEDWSLVRTRDAKAGWVLTRNLRMAIPDEVAQYAEGHRITAYFSLGDVRDGDEVKHNWLWTTILKGGEPYQFDSFRVFVWSLRRHRYETAYIERNVIGYYPVEVHPVTLSSRKGSFQSPGFSLLIENAEGKVYRRTYAFQGYRVGLVTKEPWERPSDKPETARTAQVGKEQLAAQPKSLPARVKDTVAGWWKRWPGR